MEKEKNKKNSVMDDEKFINFLEKKDEQLVEFLTDKFGAIDGRFDRVDDRLDRVEVDIDKLKEGFGYLKNNMVTKDYLDKKLADLEGRLILIIKRGEAKFNLLLDILLERKIINKKDVDKIQAIEMFPVLN